jgi:hypothetical protein
MVCISTVYGCTVFIYFNLEFSGIENQGQGFYEGNVRLQVDSRKFFFFSNFREITFMTSLRLLQYHGSRFCATYHSLCSRKNILSTSYRKNTKVQTEQSFYRGFTRIDFVKLIYRLTINTI